MAINAIKDNAFISYVYILLATYLAPQESIFVNKMYS